jgi:glycosyltransferase involved in cell wall biosynthesis
MVIVHIGISSHFTEGTLYQDNILAEMNAKAGHKVVFISDTNKFENGILTKTGECDYVLKNGVRLIRVNYDMVINEFVSCKVRKAKKVLKYLREIEPDAILYHGVCGYELMNVADYVKEHQIPFYVDSHENFDNTAKNWLSKAFYKYIQGWFVYKALPMVNKVLYVGLPEKEYLKEMYNISDEKLEFFPLGGIPMGCEQRKEYRESILFKRGWKEDVIICSHSGKMNKGKRTEEILNALKRIKDDRLRLIVFGTISEEMKPILEPLIEADKRVLFMGWLNADEQREILGATDLYIQPGTYSATAQNAMCSGCAVLLNRKYLPEMGEAVFYGENSTEIEEILRSILNDKNNLEVMKYKCLELAVNSFNYEKLAERYLV